MKRRVLCVVLTSLLASAAAMAADAYLGASAGRSEYEQRFADGVRFDADDTGWKIFGGATFFRYLGVEGGYVEFGTFDETVGDTTLDAEVKAWDAFGMGILPLLPKFSVWAKAGLVVWDLDGAVTVGDITNPSSSSGTDFAYGLGLSYRFKRVVIRAEWEVFEVADLQTLNLGSVGLEFRF